ncbi:MAG: sigma-70 family RNA polymerase sigma factor [Caldilineaceae bacterium]|nr:sigma-70 family RNA polymerase sigma factor [Caldilineaceae bacterium]
MTAETRLLSVEQQADNSRRAEAALVEQAKADPEAFGQLYERYVDKIYAYVFHRVNNQQEAEDLTARTFFRALSKLHTYEDRGLPFSAWLYRIAHNLVVNWHRDQSRRRFLSFDDLRLPGRKRNEPETVVEELEEHDELWQAIDRLPDDRRNLLLYKFGNHLSNIEIGDLLGKSEGAIKSLYFRTLAALRKDLQSMEQRAAVEIEESHEDND